MTHRRDFLKSTGAAGLGLFAASTRGAPLLARTPPSATVVTAVIGLNGRGVVHAQNLARLAGVELAYLCDVDSTVLAKSQEAVAKLNPKAPKSVADFRRVLDDKAVDAVFIATPDHWHAPMSVLANAAGKHVFLEKPSGHNPHEDELVAAAAAKHNRLVQLGTQRRSGPKFAELLAELRQGIIGPPYLARAWYANTRGGIGKGNPAPVPAHLDYELWQGPAPREPYRDNLIHYNWHWFTTWGTGEICNNGTHEIDVARWLMGLDYPVAVSSTGGRFHFQDDWQFPDTQEATFEFADGRMLIWHGQSCNGLKLFDRSRGTLLLGPGGSVVVDQDGWVIYDLKHKVVKQSLAAPEADALNTQGDDPLTQLHTANFLAAIRDGTPLTAPIADGAKTGLLCHLGTIAQQTGRKLRIDPQTGRILGDEDAMRKWQRDYAPGWKPSV
jgi:predicted dehydrogenase